MNRLRRIKMTHKVTDDTQALPLVVAANAPKLPNKILPFCWYFFRMFWPVLFVMMLLEAGQATFTMMLSYGMKELLDAVESVQLNEAGDVYTALKWPILVFLGYNVGMLLCARSSGGLLVTIGPRMRAKIRETLFAYLQHHSQRYFMGNFAGSLANRVNEVAMSVMHGLWTFMFDFWPVTITFIASWFLLQDVSANLANLLGWWMLVYVVVSVLLASHARKLSKDFAAARSMVSGKVVDAMTNMMNIKMFARSDFERHYIRSALKEEVSKASRTYWYMEIMRWFQGITTLVLLAGFTILSLQDVASGAMTPGGFAMVFSLVLLIMNHVRGLSRSFLEFFEYVGNIADGISIIVRPHEVVDAPKAKPLNITKGEIKYSRVHFSHDGRADVFKSMNLTIKAGQKVGLVGPSGAGKSTLVNTLLRLYDIQKGSIKIDGQDIAKHTQDSLREQIAMIPQEPMLFHRSLMENIRYGRIDATDKEVIAASKKAFCHEFIMEQPEGYSALVGERGVKLSGGQRQRIAIARAILKNAPILVLDEATSSLDSLSEKYIQKSLDNLMKGRTVLVIAHRLSTISHMDRILVMQDGKVVEDGSHDELLQVADGLYAQLWGMQAGGFLPE